VQNRLLLVLPVALAALGAIFFQRTEGESTSSPIEPKTAKSAFPVSTARTDSNATAVARGRDAFVGSTACVPCHQAESALYAGSHHAHALAKPTRDMAKNRFDHSEFTTKLGGTTKFSVKDDGTPVMTAPGADGKLQSLPIVYVSGVWPLEQYVVEAERGKLQSLGVVWDSRSEHEGGNRWLHVYGPDGIPPGDTLFFTSGAQNWNHTCADCHSTLVQRRYDAEVDSFDTRWGELSVGCEACHGPGAEHVRTARVGGTVARFSAPLKASVPWAPSSTGSPVPRPQDGVEVTACAPCHSRRTPLKEGFIASDPLLDFFEPELLWPGRYHADGQVEGEVYEWGSFLQSRMHEAGVRCSDCHNPHSGKPRAEGNALCVPCHEPARFETSAHSHHEGARAPRCIDCHMPPTTFMQIDERRDHSIRIPRPDLSVEFGTPNACNGCHEKKSAVWARDTVAEWFPHSHERPHFAVALAKDRAGTPDAPRALRELASDGRAPAIARATALDGLGRYPGEKNLRVLQAALSSADALVVYGAVLGAGDLPRAERTMLLLPLVSHRVRAIRIATAQALADVSARELPAGQRSALERAFVEVEESFQVSASQASTQVEKSAFELARGQLERARSSLDVALRIQPCLAEAHLNRADLERASGDEAASERAIREAIACSPESAAAHHALGLWQVRAQKSEAALHSLKKAAMLAPTDARFAYVYAVALAGSGARDQAIRVLEASLGHHPNDVNSLQALAAYLSAAGQSQRAADVRRQLDALLLD